MTKQFYRHGDISFHPVSEVPKGLKKEERESYTAAYGEVTGHHHTFNSPVRLKDDGAPLPPLSPKVTIYTSDDGRRFVEFDYRTPLDHHDHGLLVLEKGVYEIIEERERDPFESAIRKVID